MKAFVFEFYRDVNCIHELIDEHAQEFTTRSQSRIRQKEKTGYCNDNEILHLCEFAHRENSKIRIKYMSFQTFINSKSNFHNLLFKFIFFYFLVWWSPLYVHDATHFVTAKWVVRKRNTQRPDPLCEGFAFCTIDWRVEGARHLCGQFISNNDSRKISKLVKIIYRHCVSLKYMEYADRQDTQGRKFGGRSVPPFSHYKITELESNDTQFGLNIQTSAKSRKKFDRTFSRLF